MLEKYYAEHSITPSEPQTNLKFSRMYVQDILQRLEKYGNLGRLEDIAKFGRDEEFYNLQDGFVVPDTDVEEAGTQEHFEQALKEGFYVTKFAELHIDPDIPPPPPAKPNVAVDIIAMEETKEKNKQRFPTKVSQVLAKILIARDSGPTPTPFPNGSPKLLDQLASQLMNDPNANVEEVMAKLKELVGGIAVTYTRAVFECLALASQQVSQQNFDFAPLRARLETFQNPQSNELAANLSRLQVTLQDYLMRAAVDDMVKKKSAATSVLLREVKRLANEKKPAITDECARLMAEAEKQVRVFVRLNNEYVTKYPSRSGKKLLDESKEVADLCAVVKAASKPTEPEVLVTKKRAREGDDSKSSCPQWGTAFDDPPK